MISTPGIQKTLNYLSGNRAVFTLPDFSKTSFTINGFNLPGMQLPPAIQDTSNILRPLNGETLTYDDLTIRFIVMEDLSNWLELHSWVRGLGAPDGKHEYRDYVAKNTPLLDGYVTIYSAHNNPLVRFKFIGLTPVQLAGFEFTEELQETTAVVSSLTMAYERYDIELV